MTDTETTPRDELDGLVDMLIRFAQEMLGKASEFYPFAGVVDSDGQQGMVGAYTGDEHPPSQELIDLLKGGLKKRAAAHEIRASGICYDVRFRPEGGGDPVDAICVALEHTDDEPVRVLLPYRINRGLLRKSVAYGDLVAQAGDREIFVDR